MPPLRATLVLITTCSAAAATIFLVHRQQTVDRERMHRGVLRDEAIDAAGALSAVGPPAVCEVCDLSVSRTMK